MEFQSLLNNCPGSAVQLGESLLGALLLPAGNKPAFDGE